MASRKVHNYVAKILTNLSEKEIDEVNKDIDEPYKYLGRYHRKLYHDENPARIDSLLVSRGRADKELIRQIHIFVDENPEMSKILEAYLLLRKKKR